MSDVFRRTLVRIGCLIALLAPVQPHAQPQSQAPSSPLESALVQPDWCRALPRPGYKTLERVAVRDPWLEVYRVSPGVFAIYEPHQWQEAIQYLILGSRQAVLLDTGMGITDLKSLVRELTPLPILVVNSHTHMDHTGNNWQFDQVATLDSEYSRHNSLGADNLRGEVSPEKLCGALPSRFDAAGYRTRPWKITRTIHDGEKLDLGGRVLTVIATPGHAPDSLCLLDRAHGLLFTGDTYYPGPIYVLGEGSSPSAYLASVHRLAALAPAVKTVLGGHNFPVASSNVLTHLASEFAATQSGEIKGQPVGEGALQFQGPTLTFFITARQ